MQALKAGVVRLQRHAEAVLGDEELHEGADPLLESLPRLGRVLQLLGEGDALVDLMTVDGDDELGPVREMSVHGADTQSGPPRDVPDGGLHAPLHEHLGRGIQECLTGTSGAGLAGPYMS